MCEHLDDYGNSLHCGRAPHLRGGWAEHTVLLPRSVLFRVPDALPDHVAVLTEIMAVTQGTAAICCGRSTTPCFWTAWSLS
jgi:threonine dehydrogenase-like Zn-dependent dehydrogenase